MAVALLTCICGRIISSPGFAGQESCPCGLVWVYEEGVRPTFSSIDHAAAALVLAEREACANLADLEPGATEGDTAALNFGGSRERATAIKIRDAIRGRPPV